MPMRYEAVHMPAMTLQEAAMLPAMIPSRQMTAGNLLIRRPELDYRSGPMEPDKPGTARRGSLAGRAVFRAAGAVLPGVRLVRNYAPVPD